MAAQHGELCLPVVAVGDAYGAGVYQLFSAIGKRTLSMGVAAEQQARVQVVQDNPGVFDVKGKSGTGGMKNE